MEVLQTAKLCRPGRNLSGPFRKSNQFLCLKELATAMSFNPISSFSTLCIGSGFLATKTTIVSLLCGRTRLMTGKYAQPEDSESVAAPLLKGLLFCNGPDFGGEDFIRRCERLTANCAQNEPFFLLLAITGELSGKVSHSSSENFIKVYCASRAIHSVAFLLGPRINAAVRNLSWAVGALATIGYAAMVYQGSRF